MANESRQGNVLSVWLGSGGVAGVIAIMITAAILYRYVVHGPGEPVPDLLANALTTILGFYFATGAMAFALRVRGGAS